MCACICAESRLHHQENGPTPRPCVEQDPRVLSTEASVLSLGVSSYSNPPIMDGLNSCISFCLSAQVLAAKLLNFVLPNISLGRIDSSVLSRNKSEVSMDGHGGFGDGKQVKAGPMRS